MYISTHVHVAYASLTSSMYMEVKLGPQDPSVFDPPVSCIADLEKGADRTSNETPNDKVRVGESIIIDCGRDELGRRGVLSAGEDDPT